MSQQTIEHTGVVTFTGERYIQVKITQQSACAACHAKGACIAANAKEKIIELENDNCNVSVGDEVVIIGSSAMGLRAVWWAFGAPLVLILIILLIANMLKINENLSALLAGILLIIYLIILYFFRNKFKSKFQFRIKC